MSQEAGTRYRSAILFTGHMVDLPSRTRVRFPPAMEAAASRELAAALDRQLEHVDVSEVVAISSLARGGDILFQEHAEERHLASYIVLPFEPQVLVKKSVLGVPTGDWEARFWRVWNRTPSKHREVVTSSADENPYEAVTDARLRSPNRYPKRSLLSRFSMEPRTVPAVS